MFAALPQPAPLAPFAPRQQKAVGLRNIVFKADDQGNWQGGWNQLLNDDTAKQWRKEQDAAMKTKQEKGNCPKCGGTGRVSWFFNLGFAKAFKPCVACNGTGDKDWMDKE